MADILIQLVPTLVVVLIYFLLFPNPLYVVLKRTGKPSWLVLIAFVPYVGGFALLWYVALSRWPAMERETAAVQTSITFAATP